MWREFIPLHMPGLRGPPHQMAHPYPTFFSKMTKWPSDLYPKKHVNILILNALRNQKRSFFEWPFISQKMTFHQKTKNFGIAHKYFEHRSHLIFHFTMSKFSIQKIYPFFRFWHPDIIPKSFRYHSEGMQSPKTDNNLGTKKNHVFPLGFCFYFCPSSFVPKKS